MLDRKTKDREASIELLEDRCKNSKIWFLLFFIFGWIIAVSGICLVPYKYDELVIGAGICLLIFATWFLILMLYYVILIVLKSKEN